MNAIQTFDNDYGRLRSQLANRADEFRAALPGHIPPDKFQRTVMTAVQSNPDLLRADRGSFITSCLKAAQDGLLPDGREAALVTFNTRKKDAQGAWATHTLVQYMPMVYGLRKKILQSGEIADIQTSVVYRQEIEAGLFIYEEGTERMLRHKPLLDPAFDPTDDDIAAAYSIATFKDGSKSFEVMLRREINKVRQASQTGAVGRTTRDGRAIEPKGPWVDWFSEMARKSVMRRHSKTLPMSGDIIDVEAMSDAIAAHSTTRLLEVEPEAPVSLPTREEATAAGADPETGEIVSELAAEAKPADRAAAQGHTTEGAVAPAHNAPQDAGESVAPAAGFDLGEPDIFAVAREIEAKFKAAQTVEALDAAWKLTAQDRAAVVAEDVRYKDAFVTAFKTAKLALQGEPA